jgi:hypothetical protein
LVKAADSTQDASWFTPQTGRALNGREPVMLVGGFVAGQSIGSHAAAADVALRGGKAVAVSASIREIRGCVQEVHPDAMDKPAADFADERG